MQRSSATPAIRITPPGPRARKWIAYHRAPAARATYVEGFVWDRAAPPIRPFCTDPDANVFLDFASHVGTSVLGYNHPELLAVSQRLKSIDPDRYAGTDFISAYGEDPAQVQTTTPSRSRRATTSGRRSSPTRGPKPSRTPSRSATTPGGTAAMGSASWGPSTAGRWAPCPSTGASACIAPGTRRSRTSSICLTAPVPGNVTAASGWGPSAP